MLRKTLITTILSLLIPFASGSVSGQIHEGQVYDQGNCGSCDQGTSGRKRHHLFCPPNCGRGITTSQAAALWTGYCSEDCGFEGGGAGHGCGLFGCCRSRGCGHGCGKGCGLFKGRSRNCGSSTATDGCTFGYESGGADCGCVSGLGSDCGCVETDGQCGCKLFSCFKKKSSCGGRSCKCRLFNHHGGAGSCYQGCTEASCGCTSDAYVSSDSGCGCSSGCGKGCLKRKGSKGCGLFHGGRSNDCGNVGRGCCFSRCLHRAGRKACDGGFICDTACCSSGEMGLYSGGCASSSCDGSISTGETSAPVEGAVAPVPPVTEPATGGAVIEGQIQGSPIGDGSGTR